MAEMKTKRTKELPDPETIRGKETLSPEELAVMLGCGRTTAFDILRSGAIPSFTLGRLRRVRRIDAERYIEKKIGQNIKLSPPARGDNA